MKLSQFVACAGLVLVGSLVLVAEAGKYESAHQQYTDHVEAKYDLESVAPLVPESRYSSSADECRGYNCYNSGNNNNNNYNGNNNNNAYRAGGDSYSSNRQRYPYGPYHSYAVKPAIYGGHGMYHYQGYARHYPTGPAVPRYQPKLYRPVRSYSSGNAGGYSHGLRPVKTLVLAPAYSYQPRYPSSSSSSRNYASRYNNNNSNNNNNHNGYNNNGSQNNYRQKRGYNNNNNANLHMTSYNMRNNAGYMGASSARYNMRATNSNSMYHAPRATYY